MTANSPETLPASSKTRNAFTTVWTIVGVILLTGVLVYLLQVLSLPVAILIWTAVFVFCLRGIVNKLEELGVNRTIGTTISYIVMFIVVGAIVFLLFSPVFGLSEQFRSLVQSLPHYVDGVMAWGNELYTKYAPVIGDEHIKSIFDSVQGSLGSWASSFASMSANGLVNVGTGAANAFTAIGFALVIAFWILMALPALGREVKRLAGTKHAEDMEFLHFTFTRVMGGYIKGTLIQCLIIGVACGILFAITGVPNAAALGAITGVMNILPIIGPWLGGGAAAIMAFFASPWMAIVALVGTIVIQQVVYTFISPKILGDSVEIHPALMIFALMCGSAIGMAMSGMLGALVGMLVSIPAVAVLKACFAYYFEKRTGRELIAKDGVFFQGDPVKTHREFLTMEEHDAEIDAEAAKLNRDANLKADAPMGKAVDAFTAGEPTAADVPLPAASVGPARKGASGDALDGESDGATVEGSGQ